MASSNTVATNSNLRWFWGNAYTQIAKYNVFLENITDCPMDGDKKEIWSAEVKCLRAYFLFNLAFYYKDVPMPLKTLSVEEANTIYDDIDARYAAYAKAEAYLIQHGMVIPAYSTSGRLCSGGN